jgi:hypothetical protein
VSITCVALPAEEPMTVHVTKARRDGLVFVVPHTRPYGAEAGVVKHELVFNSTSLLQALGNASSMSGRGVLSLLYCVM